MLKACLHLLYNLRNDSFLLTNLLSILVDLSPVINNINEYTSERLITIMCKISKKKISLMEKLNLISKYDSEVKEEFLETSQSSPHSKKMPR